MKPTITRNTILTRETRSRPWQSMSIICFEPQITFMSRTARTAARITGRFWPPDAAMRRMCSSPNVRVLVQEGGAEVNVITNIHWSPLSYTSEYPEVAEALLEEGALVKFGRRSALVEAIERRDIDTLKVLLARRGFVRVIQWKDEDHNMTAREAAVSHGHDDMVGLLDEALVVAPHRLQAAWRQRVLQRQHAFLLRLGERFAGVVVEQAHVEARHGKAG